MSNTAPLEWFDAHLDLAYMAENGRDMRAPLESCGGPDLPAAVTFGSLFAGRVRRCLATIFVEADGPKSQPQSYAAGDYEGANIAGKRQMKRYAEWHKPHFYAQQAEGEHAEVQVGGGANGQAGGRGGVRSPEVAPDFLVLIEGADVILDPADLGEWRSEGVVAVGMAWWKPSRAAGGNGTDLGLTDFGRALAVEMDRLGMVHDASHLSDRAFFELLEVSGGAIMASHSNCRALVGGGGRGENQRHLHDEQIRAIVERGGVIGLNLYSRFLRPGLETAEQGRASVEDCVAQVEHVCAIAGDRAHVGLGSDMDGGFSAARLPEGIDSPVGLQRLAEALSARGWSDDEVRGFASGNWARFWGLSPAGE